MPKFSKNKAALYIQSIYTLQKSKIHTIYLKIVIAKQKKKIVCLGHSHPKK